MDATQWDPVQYLRFVDERTRPLHDLLTRIPTLPQPRTPTILDIGCGPGNSTAALRRHWPHAHLTGLDNSPRMLATARTHGEPRAHYLLADARTHDPAPHHPDLILSNATLQWLNENETPRPPQSPTPPRTTAEHPPGGHLTLLRTWAAALRPGAVLALQVPGNFDAPSHTLLAELRHSPRWQHLLGDDTTRAAVHTPAVHTPTEYLDTLTDAHCTADVWETTYSTLLTGPDPVLEWVKGTALRPLLGRLTDPADQTAFLTEYGTLLRRAYPAGPHGTVFPFRRIFAVAVRH